MPVPRCFARCLAVALLLCGTVRAAPDDPGFVSLFDGKTLNGWHVMGTPGWTVQEGVLVAPGRGSGWLRSDKEYENFVLRVEFKNSPKGNSGVFIRGAEKGRTSRTGMEIQILDDFGKRPDKNSSGSLYDMIPPTASAVKPAGEWNDYEITARGTHIQVRLNGQLVQDIRTDDPALNEPLARRVAEMKARHAAQSAAGKTTRPFENFPLLKERRTRGHIGLQNHGTPVQFRNVRIQVL